MTLAVKMALNLKRTKPNQTSYTDGSHCGEVQCTRTITIPIIFSYFPL